MAKQSVMTPGATGGKDDDSFTFGSFLDSIIDREIKNKELLREDQKFKDYFKSMIASPEEYTAWQDKQYAKINREEASRQAAENTDASLQSMGVKWDDVFKKAGLPSNLSEDVSSQYRREMDTLDGSSMDWLKDPTSSSIPDAITEALSRPAYTDEDLLGMGTGLTKEDLNKQRQWWKDEESGKSFRRTAADWEEYARISDLYEAAKKARGI